MTRHSPWMAAAVLLLAGCGEAPEEDVPRILAAVGGFVGPSETPGGILESTDGGLTWRTSAWPHVKGVRVCPAKDGSRLYAAGGNGIFVSGNGGVEWRLTGGFSITEVQDVAPDPEDSARAWAVSGYGLHRTEDAGRTWTTVPDAPFRFAKAVALAGDRLFVGSEEGLFSDAGRGGKLVRRGPPAPIRCLLVQGERIWCGTDGLGLWRSRGGDAWNRVEGPGEVVNGIVAHPTDPARLFAVEMNGVAESRDGGSTWSRLGDPNAGAPCYTVLALPGGRDRLLLGTGKGLYESRDGGRTWALLSLENAIVNHVVAVDVPKGDAGRLSREPGRLDLPPVESRGLPAVDPFQNRAGVVKAHALAKEGDAGLFELVVRLREGPDRETALARLREVIEKPGRDMFWAMMAHQVVQRCGDLLPDDLIDSLRHSLVENGLYRGDTENHLTMYYAGLLLSAETWPETSEADWYNGRTSAENHAEAKGWLENQIQRMAREGSGEFDTPAYFYVYLQTYLLLHDHARGPRVRKLAEMALDLLLADYAAEALGPRYCGAHSRMYADQVRRGDGWRMWSAHWLLFGSEEPPAELIDWIYPAVYTSYRLPPIIRAIATNRSKPYVHLERKRVRDCMRYTKHLNPPVHKYTYMTSRYAMGCCQGGILQPIQQHSWDVTWIGDSEDTTLFTVHPHHSARELGMFFPEDPHYLVDIVGGHKTDYRDGDKMTAASPYERIFQSGSRLQAIYDIPETDAHRHVSLFWPKSLSHEREGGWHVGRDGPFWVAVYASADGEWSDAGTHRRFEVPAGRVWFLVQAGSAEEDGSFEAFRKRILAKPIPFLTAGHMEQPYLYDGPFMKSGESPGVIEIRHGERRRVLDFNALTIREE